MELTTDLPEVAIARIAAAQQGLVTREQALAVGMHRRVIERRLAGGSWVAVRRGVYRSAFAPPSWHQRALAACIGPHGALALSHRSAAYVHGLIPKPPRRMEVMAPRCRAAKAVGTIATVHRPERLDGFEIVMVGGIPVTTVVRTLSDLAGTTAPAALREMVDRAFQACAGAGSRAALLAGLRRAGATRRPGSPALRSAIDPWIGEGEHPRELESVLEAEVMRVLQDGGLPTPVVQHPIRLPTVGSVRVDFAWPDEHVALEVDGYAYHSSRASFDHDRARGNELVLGGWQVLHTTATELRRAPGALVEAVAGTLACRRT